MKRLFSLLHRWLGLVSGLIVMVVCLTGSLYVFRDEVEAVCEPWRRVPVRDAEMLPPSALLKAAGEASALTLGTAGEAARLDAYTPQGTTTTYVDPYTGEVLKVIRSLAEQKTTMIIVTHEMAFARDVADQVIFMDGGLIVEQGDARQVIENPRQERTKQFLARYSGN